MKTGYHLVPYHVRDSDIFVSCLYSNLFVRYECLFTYSQNVYFTIFSDYIVLFSSYLGMKNTMMQKSEFLKMQDCSRFLQIGSHMYPYTYRGY